MIVEDQRGDSCSKSWLKSKPEIQQRAVFAQFYVQRSWECPSIYRKFYLIGQNSLEIARAYADNRLIHFIQDTLDHLPQTVEVKGDKKKGKKGGKPEAPAAAAPTPAPSGVPAQTPVVPKPKSEEELKESVKDEVW